MRRSPQLSRGEVMGPGLGWAGAVEKERKETVGREVKEAESTVVADGTYVGEREGGEAKMRLKFLVWVADLAALETGGLGKRKRGKRGKGRKKTHLGT